MLKRRLSTKPSNYAPSHAASRRKSNAFSTRRGSKFAPSGKKYSANRKSKVLALNQKLQEQARKKVHFRLIILVAHQLGESLGQILLKVFRNHLRYIEMA